MLWEPEGSIGSPIRESYMVLRDKPTETETKSLSYLIHCCHTSSAIIQMCCLAIPQGLECSKAEVPNSARCLDSFTKIHSFWVQSISSFHLRKWINQTRLEGTGRKKVWNKSKHQRKNNSLPSNKTRFRGEVKASGCRVLVASPGAEMDSGGVILRLHLATIHTLSRQLEVRK